MDTHVLTPLQVFHLPQQLVIPLFQRPYVWDEPDQWQPLWQDVRRLAEVRLQDPSTKATHFLGAVVLQAHDGWTGALTTRNIIDGQQRLTTLQLLMDAASAVFEERGFDALVARLNGLTHNGKDYVHGTDSRLKVRHTNRDRAAFDEVMSTDPPVAHDQLRHPGSRITLAHRFFVAAISGWLPDVAHTPAGAATGGTTTPAAATPPTGFAPSTNQPDDSTARPAEPSLLERQASALVDVLSVGLQLVVIDLQAHENSQEIFETLNARGTPLTAADLVKNFVFQRLEAEGVDTSRAYAQDWPFESAFWETEVSVGRYPLSRSSLFLNQWLVSRVGEPISPRSTFSRFKHYVEHECGMTMSELLVKLKVQAEQYEAWTNAVDDQDRALTVTEMAVYRMQAMGVELLKPILLWVNDPDLKLTPNTIDAIVQATESWIVRRSLLRLTTSDLGRVVEDLIRTHRSTTPSLLAATTSTPSQDTTGASGQPTAVDDLADRITRYLARQASLSTYWPGDKEVRDALRTESVYRRFSRSRVRMLLEAAEDQQRARHRQPPVPRRGFHIEHVLPQNWQPNWPVDGLDAEIARGEHVHRLGNLTLLTGSLNGSVSHGAWNTKRKKLRDHDVFLLNRPLDATTAWDEAAIDARTDTLTDAILTTWPVPAGHVGNVVDPAPAGDNAWVEVKHLVAAGLLPAGSALTPRPGSWPAHQAVVQPDGRLEVDGRMFDSTSAAGKHVKGAVTNGWWFWQAPDGRPLRDLRSQYRGGRPNSGAPPFDWSGLHAILEALPAGTWTTYGYLADAVGTAPQPLGNHVTTCPQCVNAHRVLTAQGKVSSGFTWLDPADKRDPQQLLQSEGVPFDGGQARRDHLLDGDALQELLQPDSRVTAT